MRIWFPNLPSNGISIEDRSQKAIGVSRSATNLVGSNLAYLRRYLDDPESVPVAGTPYVFDAGDENSNSLYLRRYLDDLVNFAIAGNGFAVELDLVAGVYVCPAGTEREGSVPLNGSCGAFVG